MKELVVDRVVTVGMFATFDIKDNSGTRVYVRVSAFNYLDDYDAGHAINNSGALIHKKM